MHIYNTQSLCISLRKKIKLVNNIWNWILSEPKSMLDSHSSVSIPGDLLGGSEARLWRMMWADTPAFSQTRREMTRAVSDSGVLFCCLKSVVT